MPRPVRPLLLALACALAAAAQAQTLPPRPPDGLLARPDLQELEEARRLRDAAPLVRALGDADAAVRARAAFALASVPDPAAQPALVAALADPDARVRADAAFALGLAGDSAAAEALIERAGAETDEAAGTMAFDAVGRLGTADDLRRLLRRTHLLPARGVAHALARAAARGVHLSEAASWLAARLLSEGAATRAAAAYALGRSPRADWWAPHADEVRSAAAALDTADPAAMHLALALGRLGDAGDAAALERLLASPDWRVRVNAARALAGRSPDALLAALDDPNVLVAATAAQGLAAGTWTAEVAGRLQQRAEHRPLSWEVLAALAPALPPDAAAEALARAAAEADSPYARGALLGALVAAAPAERAFEVVGETAGEDPRVAYATLAALAERWDRERASTPHARRYFEAFRAGLARLDMATVYAAAPPFADSLFRPLGAVAALTETYAALRLPADIEPMVEVVRALGAAGDPAAAGLLRREAEAAGHPVVRRAAADALHALTGERTEVAPQTPDFPALDWAYLRALGARPRLTLETDRGRVVLELDPEQAPLTVQALSQLARAGRYDDVPLHRVVPNFVVQGGDFARRDGFGGPDFTLPTESTRIGYVAGAAGIASAGRDTEGSQYFVTHSAQPHLDGRYTAFGRVVEGQDVVDRLRIGDRVVRATITPTE